MHRGARRRLRPLAFAAFFVVLHAGAQTPEALYARTLAAACAQCHGTDGHPAAGSDAARLAGMPRDELLRKLREFRAGTRKATVMTQLARGYSDAQLAELADWFAAQR